MIGARGPGTYMVGAHVPVVRRPGGWFFTAVAERAMLAVQGEGAALDVERARLTFRVVSTSNILNQYIFGSREGL